MVIDILQFLAIGGIIGELWRQRKRPVEPAVVEVAPEPPIVIPAKPDRQARSNVVPIMALLMLLAVGPAVAQPVFLTKAKADTLYCPANITAGSGSELQFRSDATTFGAVTGSSVSGGDVTLLGADTDPPLTLTAQELGSFLYFTHPTDTHGHTSTLPANTWGEIAFLSGSQGIQITGINGTNNSPGLTLRSISDSTSVAAEGFRLIAAKRSGTALSPLTATNVMFRLLNSNQGDRFQVLGDGSLLAWRTVEASTAGSVAPNVLGANESRKLLTNEGATAENYHTLPTATAGVEFLACVQDADGLRLTAGASDTIRIEATASAAAGYINSTTVGSCVTLVAINAVEWVATGYTGTWVFGP